LINSSNYVEKAMRTSVANHYDIWTRLGPVSTIDLIHAAMGLATEAGEFMDTMKKHIFYGKLIDEVNLAEELSDIFWYCALACNALDVSFDDVMKINIEKLQKRYPEKFTEDAALNRDLEAEREILEKIGGTD
jgi:NTP pyrophosphatase (non-canonical NTP hydrolase)